MEPINKYIIFLLIRIATWNIPFSCGRFEVHTELQNLFWTGKDTNKKQNNGMGKMGGIFRFVSFLIFCWQMAAVFVSHISRCSLVAESISF